MFALIVSLLCLLCFGLYWHLTRGLSPSALLYLPNRLQVLYANIASTIKVTQLHVYPVKSCKPVTLHKALVTNRGLKYDREWIIIDAEEKTMVTQRQVPDMTQVTVDLVFEDGVSTEEGMSDAKHSLKALVLSKAGSSKFTLNLDSIPKSAYDDENLVEVNVWTQTTLGVDQGDDVAWWLHKALKSKFDSEDAKFPKYRLLRFKQDFSRQISQPRRLKETEEVQYADGYPVLVTSEESLALLNQWIASEQKEEEPIPMNRFRPNVVITGCQFGFLEDAFFRIKIGSTSFRIVKPCDRCVVPTTSQETGNRGKEPTRTLRRHRLSDEDVLFGQNAVPEVSTNAPTVLQVGDVVSITEVLPQFKIF